MKKILSGIIGIIGIIGLTACDKIEADEYTVYDGAAVSWTAGSGAIDNPVQNAYVEKYTGPRCPNCPDADVTLDLAKAQYGDRLVLVSINHPTGQGKPYPEQPDLRTDGGNAWDSWFGVNAIPAAFINRDKGTQYLGSMDNIVSAIGSALQHNPEVAIEVSCSTSNDNRVDASVQIQFLQSIDEKLTLTAAVVEDSLAYRQLNGSETDDNYIHNHMLRKVVTGFWGSELPASVNTQAGSLSQGNFSFSLPEEVVPQHCHLVVFLSYKGSRQVLNCASCEIGD